MLNKLFSSVSAFLSAGSIKECNYKKCRDNSELAEFVDAKKSSLHEHMSVQMDKAKEMSHVIPEEYVLRCEAVFSKHMEDAAWNILCSKKYSEAQNYRYQDNAEKINMIVTVLPWATNESIEELRKLSDDRLHGYMWLLAKIFLNDWPSSDIKEFFHVVVCQDGDDFQLHVGMGDYGGSPTAPRKFSLVPVDLLNDREREAMGL